MEFYLKDLIWIDCKEHRAVSHKFELPDETIARLEKLARPFKDTTPLAVLMRGIDCLEREAAQGEQTVGENVYVLPNRPNVAHTRILSASLGEDALSRTNWNDLYRRVHEAAFKTLGSLERVKSISSANVVPGHRTDSGYMPLDDYGFSVQGSDANSVLLSTFDIVRQLGMPLKINFEWRDKDGAQRPGQRATVLSLPSEQKATTSESPQPFSTTIRSL